MKTQLISAALLVCLLTPAAARADARDAQEMAPETKAALLNDPVYTRLVRMETGCEMEFAAVDLSRAHISFCCPGSPDLVVDILADYNPRTKKATNPVTSIERSLLGCQK